MKNATAVATGGLIAAALAGFTVLGGMHEPAPPQASSTRTPGVAVTSSVAPVVPAGFDVPAGWRVETYGTVVFAVPASWRDAGPTVCRGSSVFGGRDATAAPAVERPGPVPAVGCPPAAGGRPSESVAGGGTFVAVDDAGVGASVSTTSPDAAGAAPAGTPSDPVLVHDRASFTLDGIPFAVQAEPRLRAQILATFRSSPDGADGCLPSVDLGRGERPDAAPLARVGTVSAVSVCQYAKKPDLSVCSVTTCTTPAPSDPADKRLFASRRLESDRARTAVDALLTAPTGGGPDGRGCEGDPAEDEVIVLHVTGSAGRSDVVVHYAGCTGRGIDDGATIRALTRPALAPVLGGAVRVTADGSEIADVVETPGPARPTPVDGSRVTSVTQTDLIPSTGPASSTPSPASVTAVAPPASPAVIAPHSPGADPRQATPTAAPAPR